MPNLFKRSTSETPPLGALSFRSNIDNQTFNLVVRRLIGNMATEQDELPREMNELFNAIRVGACNATTILVNTSSALVLAKMWPATALSLNAADIYLESGPTTSLNLSTTFCLDKLITQKYNVYLAHNSQDDGMWGFMIGMLSIMVVFAALFTGCSIRCCVRNQLLRAANGALEAGEAGNVDGPQQPPQPPTLKEKLLAIQAELQLQGKDLPGKFFCLISKEPMNDPVVIDDGHTYDRESVEMYQRTAVRPICPNDVSKLITVILPNHNLRSEMHEYVDEYEKEKAARLEAATTARRNSF